MVGLLSHPSPAGLSRSGGAGGFTMKDERLALKGIRRDVVASPALIVDNFDQF